MEATRRIEMVSKEEARVAELETQLKSLNTELESVRAELTSMRTEKEAAAVVAAERESALLTRLTAEEDTHKATSEHLKEVS